MRQENRDSMEDLLADRLEVARNGVNEDERSTALKDAATIMGYTINQDKNDDAFQEHTEKLAFEREKLELEKERLALERIKQEHEKAKLALELTKLEQDKVIQEAQLLEAKKKEKWARVIGLGTAVVSGVVGIGVPLLLDKSDKRFKSEFAADCFRYESDGCIPTSTPSKSTRDFLRHK
jgi:hypothetical protein